MESKLGTMEALFKALGDRTRLRILGLLVGGEVCVCHIHESLKIPQPKASRHLAYLRRAGLVQARKDGLWVHYSLASPADALIRTLMSSTIHCLSHVPVTARDAARLEKLVGCCAPKGLDLLPVVECCGEARVANERSRVVTA